MRFVQATTNPKKAIPQCLSIHSPEGPPGKETVFWIEPIVLRAHSRRLAVSPGCHHQPMHGLDTPSPLHKLHGQPVQEIGVGGTGPRSPKISQGLYNPPAEVVPPDPIHHHPSGQGIVRFHQPLGQS